VLLRWSLPRTHTMHSGAVQGLLLECFSISLAQAAVNARYAA
jgi:hypothetical protein